MVVKFTKLEGIFFGIMRKGTNAMYSQTSLKDINFTSVSPFLAHLAIGHVSFCHG